MEACTACGSLYKRSKKLNHELTYTYLTVNNQ